MRAHDQIHLRRAERLQLAKVQMPSPIRSRKPQFRTICIPQSIERPQNAVVFHIRRNNRNGAWFITMFKPKGFLSCVYRMPVLTPCFPLHNRRRCTPDRHIQRLRCTRRKDHPLRMGKSKQRSQSPACLHDRSVCSQVALRVAARRIAKRPQGLHHRLRDAGRLLQRSRRRIEVDRLLSGSRHCIGMYRLLSESRRRIEINGLGGHILTTLPASAMVCAITYIFVMPPTRSLSLRP